MPPMGDGSYLARVRASLKKERMGEAAPAATPVKPKPKPKTTPLPVGVGGQMRSNAIDNAVGSMVSGVDKMKKAQHAPGN